MGKILALDYGDQRTGLAISDEDQRWSFGRGVINGNVEMVLSEIEKIVAAEKVQSLVVGWPVSLKERGSTGAQAGTVKAFVKKLSERINLPVHLEEERLTSALGRRLNRAAGKSGQTDDETAARLILEGYLERLHHD